MMSTEKIIQDFINNEHFRLENFIAEFLNTLNPPLKKLSAEVVKKRNIVRVVQGNKTWITTNGSRASRVLTLGPTFDMICTSGGNL